MAYLELQASADYNVHQAFEAELTDHEDHTFCGIMFDVQAKCVVPLEYVELQQIWVRGMLGNLTVWTCEGSHEGYFDDRAHWRRVFKGARDPSPHALVPLALDPPVRVPRGQRAGLYVHSTRQDDQAIVYDNRRRDTSFENDALQIFPGEAHISNVPFSSQGWWGYAWRPDREFVGRISCGVRYMTWQPAQDVHALFPGRFRSAARTLVLCAMREGCALRRLPLEVTFYVLNMCGWDWFGALEEGEGAAQQARATRMRAVNDAEDQEDEEGGVAARGIGWHRGDYRARIERHRLTSRRLLAAAADRRRTAGGAAAVAPGGSSGTGSGDAAANNDDDEGDDEAYEPSSGSDDEDEEGEEGENDGDEDMGGNDSDDDEEDDDGDDHMHDVDGVARAAIDQVVSNCRQA